MLQNLDDLRGHSVREWVSMSAPRAEIKTRFKRFLATYVDEFGTNVYREKIRQMCESESRCIIVYYVYLFIYLLRFLVDCAAIMKLFTCKLFHCHFIDIVYMGFN